MLVRQEFEYNYLIIIKFFSGVGGREMRFQRTTDASGRPTFGRYHDATRVAADGVGHIRRGTPRMATGRSRA